MSSVSPDPEQAAFESALGGLTPARSRIDRDRLMFEAGARSARRPPVARWAWPSVAAALAAVVACESAALAVRPEVRVVIQAPPAPAPGCEPVRPEPVEVLVQSPERRPIEDVPSPPADEAAALRRQVLRFGLDGLPEAPPLLSQSRGEPGPGAGDGGPAPLHRYELNKVLDLGGPS